MQSTNLSRVGWFNGIWHNSASNWGGLLTWLGRDVLPPSSCPRAGACQTCSPHHCLPSCPKCCSHPQWADEGWTSSCSKGKKLRVYAYSLWDLCWLHHRHHISAARCSQPPFIPNTHSARCGSQNLTPGWCKGGISGEKSRELQSWMLEELLGWWERRRNLRKQKGNVWQEELEVKCAGRGRVVQLWALTLPSSGRISIHPSPPCLIL